MDGMDGMAGRDGRSRHIAGRRGELLRLNERHLLIRDEGNSQVHYLDLGAPEKTWHIDVPVGCELTFRQEPLPHGHGVQFFSSGQQSVRRVKAPALATPSFFCGFQLLPSGHYLVINWQGHGTATAASASSMSKTPPENSFRATD